MPARCCQNRSDADLKLSKKRHSLKRQDQSGHKWYDQVVICSVDLLRGVKRFSDMEMRLARVRRPTTAALGDTMDCGTFSRGPLVDSVWTCCFFWSTTPPCRWPNTLRSLIEESNEFTKTKWLASCQLATMKASPGERCNQCQSRSKSPVRRV